MRRRGAICLALCAGMIFGTSDLHTEGPQHSKRPVPRPSTLHSAPDSADSRNVDVERAIGMALGLQGARRPVLRPGTLSGNALAVPLAPVTSRRKARICGLKSLRGVRLASIPAARRGCGVAQPVKITSLAGLAFSRPAIMDCTTAQALERWLRKAVIPQIGRRGGGVVGVDVIASYSCRTRNNRPGAKISEHGRGKAVDIAGFMLRDGGRISVLKDWGKGRSGRILKRLHKAACGTFGTVLGPNSDRFHRNHFHLDTARYRGGAYCR